MRRRCVEVPVVLLHVLAVVAFHAGEPEEALLQDGVLAVPQRDGERDDAAVVAEAEQAVLAPPISARDGVFVREVAPGVAVGGVILAHGSPLALGEIRAPAPPFFSGARLLQALMLRGTR